MLKSLLCLLACALFAVVVLFATPSPLLAQSTPTPTATPIQIKATILKSANLRAGPATTFAIVGSAKANQQIVITGKNSKGDWYQLADGKWIAAFLVSKVTGSIPVVTVALPIATTAPIVAAPLAPATAKPTATTPPPAAPAPAPIAADPAANTTAFQCTGGCSVAPDPSCAIKGNVNSKKEKIYHMPGWRDYDRTNVKPGEGDRWFCTEAEALAAGFRAPLNH